MTTAPLILTAPSTLKKGSEFYDYSIDLSDAYLQAILSAGGMPWISPCAPTNDFIIEAVRRADGVFLTGGDDIQPSLYATKIPEQVLKTCGEHDPKRDLFELMLIQETFKQRKPLLAICRGFQILNVALGGSLFTDIPLQAPGPIQHSRMDLKHKAVHEIRIEPDSILGRAINRPRLGVNSTHHQGIRELGKGLRVVASADDGIIEAIELKAEDSHLMPFLLGVQFHPERLIYLDSVYAEIFNSFIASCALNRVEERQSLVSS
ncbi:MAG: gamma-glutamyl-gamma-aminobutyrate hydrolase family protein [Verrucomicrobiota bacterium]|nr:gamma-glutamyl-gamma-aminobutyrate hydrolase family protein [Verrucomicrobiota bacterium]